LRVAMPATPADARDLLIASVLCDDPVIYIDDRWLYELEQPVAPVAPCHLADVCPRVIREGRDVTLVGASHSTLLCQEASDVLSRSSIDAEVIDLRIVAPLDIDPIVRSVRKTGRLCVVDGSWASCGLAAEVIAAVVEKLEPRALRAPPCRVTLPAAPAPTSRVLEAVYYPTSDTIASAVRSMVQAAGG
jgi:acetoin:2,6-dichlorophenolindophenol oxidoreductase subunit beta